MEHYVCHDCKRDLKHNEEYMPYKVGEEIYIKCKACYEKEPALHDFQKTEVYSRVVGYIRPIQQWNKGKAAEYQDRKEFVVEQPTCSC
ncbi:hypothetical protein EPO05_05395 [Patescibacteria group bacterium]|nr:MAG: hypothetical protein EPO05_05395 [Patescibacteria group bacterium]